jgi:hypothetical protein
MKIHLLPLILALLFCLTACAASEQPKAEGTALEMTESTSVSTAELSDHAVEAAAPAEESSVPTEEPETPIAELESTPESSESGQSSAPVITQEEYESFGVTVQGAEKKARGFRDFSETMNSDFVGTWYDPELGEAIRLTETEAFVYIPYLELYGDTGYPWRLVDRSEEGKCPKLSIDCFENGASLAYYVAGNTGEYFWCVSQGQLFYRQD